MTCRKLWNFLTTMLCLLICLQVPICAADQSDDVDTENMSAICRALDILDSAYVGAEDREPGWTYYYAIKGPTATSFLDALEGKELLTGIDAAILDRARESADALKNMLIDYDGIRDTSYSSEQEKILAKYAYYEENYEELCGTFKIFYEDLNTIYCTIGISELVSLKGKTPQMQMMIAQSYALYTALDDSVTMDENWTLDSYSINEILYEAHRLTDSNNVSPEAISLSMENGTDFVPPVQNGQNSDGSSNQDGTLENAQGQDGKVSQTAPNQDMVVMFPYDLVGCASSTSAGLFLALSLSVVGVLWKKKEL